MKDEDVGEGLVPSRCPKRKTARLKDFDYAQANTVFFITLCSLGKRQVFVRHDFNIEVVGCIKKERERVNYAVYVFCCKGGDKPLPFAGNNWGLTRHLGYIATGLTPAI